MFTDRPRVVAVEPEDDHRLKHACTQWPIRFEGGNREMPVSTIHARNMSYQGIIRDKHAKITRTN